MFFHRNFLVDNVELLCLELWFRMRNYLLDEPLSAVDASLRQSMMEEILKINQNQGSTIFMISHNEREFQNVSLNNPDNQLILSFSLPNLFIY